MKFGFLAAAAMMLMVPAGAQAGTFIGNFNGICASTMTATQAACSTALTGTYGNVATLNATNDSTLKVQISAWQASQSTGAITSAFLGSYSGGFGVTGLGDQNGANNYHTIDNTGGYTDFVMLQFSRAVELSSIGTNAYPLTVGGQNVTDSDLSFFNANGIVNPTAWNIKKDISSSVSGLYNQPSLWTNVSSSSQNPRPLNIAGDQFSTVWLVSASMLTNDQNDGFKLSQILVQPQIPPIPEPATWGMLIVGFGAIGATLRRRVTAGVRFA